MRFRTWPVAALALGGLLLLVVVSVATASRRAQEIYTQLDHLNTHHREIEAKFRRLRSDIHLSGIFIRDYLLDTERERASGYRARLADFRRTNLATFSELRELGRRDQWEDARMATLQAKLEDYWRAYEPLFDWRAGDTLARGAAFLRTDVLPHREAVLALAREIEDLNNENLAAERAEVIRRHAAFRRDLLSLLWQTLLLGAAVAAVAVVRLRRLERLSAHERAVAEEAERQTRKLSQQLVATQEEERRKLSRELHDHVGQMLTALRMELGRAERLRGPQHAGAAEALAASRSIVDEMVRTVRDLALGLRPSMLDDFGLQPALEWHVRDVQRRCGLPIGLSIDGDLEGVREPHRTCVYRTVQEALTNCVRHARATRADVDVRGGPSGLRVSIFDDGVGIEPAQRRSGLGLRGIEERVRDLGGTVHVRSAPGQGTTITIDLPYPSEAEATRARATG